MCHCLEFRRLGSDSKKKDSEGETASSHCWHFHYRWWNDVVMKNVTQGIEMWYNYTDNGIYDIRPIPAWWAAVMHGMVWKGMEKITHYHLGQHTWQNTKSSSGLNKLFQWLVALEHCGCWFWSCRLSFWTPHLWQRDTEQDRCSFSTADLHKLSVHA